MAPWSRVDLSRFHPEARMILDHPRDWSQSDEVAPLGSDLGADILGEWRKLRDRTPKAIGQRFEVDVNDSADTGAMDRIQLMLAVAFAHVKTTSTCPPDLAMAALEVLDRDRDAAMQSVTAPHHATFQAAWDRYRRILSRFAGDAGQGDGRARRDTGDGPCIGKGPGDPSAGLRPSGAGPGHVPGSSAGPSAIPP